MNDQRFQSNDSYIVFFLHFVFAPSQFPYVHQTLGFDLADVSATGSPQVKLRRSLRCVPPERCTAICWLPE